MNHPAIVSGASGAVPYYFFYPIHAPGDFPSEEGNGVDLGVACNRATFPFIPSFNGYYYCQEIEMIKEPAGSRERKMTVPNRTGNRTYGGKVDSRIITVSGTIFGDTLSEADIRTAEQEFLKYHRIGTVNKLYIEEDRYINVQVKGINLGDITGKPFRVFSVNFLAEDPYFYDETITSFINSVTFGSGTSTITNSGHFSIYPTVTIIADDGVLIRLKNTENNTILHAYGTGSQLIIDTARKKAYDASGNLLMGELVNCNFRLETGANVVTHDVPSGSLDLNVSYRNKYLSI